MRGKKLVFWPIARLAGATSVFTIGRGDLADYRLKAKTQQTYAACEVTFLDPDTKKLTSARVTAAQARERIIVATEQVTGVPPQMPSRTLRQGTQGEDVRSWQTWLNGHGFDCGTADGIFGAKTRNATIAFQRANRLTPDGVAGSETFRIAIEQGFGSDQQAGARTEVAGLVLYKQVRVESVAQAEAKARELLDAANRLKASGSLSLPLGDTRAVAGAKISLTRMGRMSGAYLIQSSTHRMDRSGGYTTSVEVTGV